MNRQEVVRTFKDEILFNIKSNIRHVMAVLDISKLKEEYPGSKPEEVVIDKVVESVKKTKDKNAIKTYNDITTFKLAGLIPQAGSYGEFKELVEVHFEGSYLAKNPRLLLNYLDLPWVFLFEIPISTRAKNGKMKEKEGVESPELVPQKDSTSSSLPDKVLYEACVQKILELENRIKELEGKPAPTLEDHYHDENGRAYKRLYY